MRTSTPRSGKLVDLLQEGRRDRHHEPAFARALRSKPGEDMPSVDEA
jgi:hypothetical protein